MFTPIKIEDCHDTMVIAMTVYIQQLQSDNAYLEREVDRLKAELEAANAKPEAAKRELYKISPLEWANAYGYKLSDLASGATVDSDKDPFEEGAE